MSWTDHRIDQLKMLWKKGSTASQIADALGGVTRNAVIGKAHRLGLKSRPSPVSKVEPRSKQRPLPAPPVAARSVADRSSPVPLPAEPASKPAPPPTGPPDARLAPPVRPAPPRRKIPAKPSTEMRGKVRMLDLTDKICKWPLGHPGEPDFPFCGEPVNDGFPYCRSHCAVAYQAPRERGHKPAPRAGWPRFR